MASTKCTLLLLGVVICALALTPGCFFMEANLKVNVDGSSAVEMKAGISEALANMGEKGEDPFKDFDKDIPKGWKAEPLQLEGWKGFVLSGTVPAGEQIMPATKGEKSDLKVQVVKRLLSTDYMVNGNFEMSQPGGEQPGAKDKGETNILPGGRIRFVADEKGKEGDEGKQDEGFDPKALAGLLGAGGQQPHITFSVKAPGTILETTGQVNDEGVAVWKVDLSSMMGDQKPPDVKIALKSRLANSQNIGRLADELAAERDMPDMAALIADDVSRDLLPNPVRDAPLKAALDAGAYGDAISIIVTLDDTVGKAATARVIKGLKLNTDDVTAARLHQVWEALAQADPDELVEVVADALVKHLRMLGK